MSKIFISVLFLLLCTFAFASVPYNIKQQKRGVGNDGWIGLSNPYGYGHGHPWSKPYDQYHNSWKGLELSEVNLHAGLHLAGIDDFSTYGGDSIDLTPGILKTLPMYITKRAAVSEKSKAKPVPKPVITEKPYRVPMEKMIPVPIEKIVHKPVTVPIPTPQMMPIPVKDPIAAAVQQPYPVRMKHPVPVPVPLAIPLPVHPLSPFQLPSFAANGLPGAIYGHGYAINHFYPPLFIHSPSLQLDHGIAGLFHGFDHGIGHVLAYGYGHDYIHNPNHYAHDHFVHGHEHKKKKTDKH